MHAWNGYDRRMAATLDDAPKAAQSTEFCAQNNRQKDLVNRPVNLPNELNPRPDLYTLKLEQMEPKSNKRRLPYNKS